MFLFILIFFIGTVSFAEESQYEIDTALYLSVEYEDGRFEIENIYDYVDSETIKICFKEGIDPRECAFSIASNSVGVKSVEYVLPINMAGEPSDVNQSDRWKYDVTFTTQVWDEILSMNYNPSGLNEITIAVLDSGIKLDHSDLNVITDADALKGSDVADWDDDPTDYTGHGTHVAGIVGAYSNGSKDQVVGLAPGIKILPVKVFTNSGIGNTYTFIKGIYQAIKNDVDVITLSAGYPKYSEQMETALQIAYDQGIVIVTSAGNGSNHWVTGDTFERKNRGDRYSSIIDYPAIHDTVLSVGNAAYKDGVVGIDDSSNIGGVVDGEYRALDVIAPGTFIYSSSLNESVPKISTGTSMATPFVAGLAVLLKVKYENIPPAAVFDIIIKSADDTNIKYPLEYDKKDAMGNGLVNVEQALGFSPLRSLYISDGESFLKAESFLFDPVKLNYLVNVSPDLEFITFDGIALPGTTITIEGQTYSDISQIKLPMEDDITVFEIVVHWDKNTNISDDKKWNGITRRYKFFVKRKQNISDSQILGVNIVTQNLNEKLSESNMDYYISFDKEVDEVQFSVLTKETPDPKDEDASISFITSEGESGFIYKSGAVFTVKMPQKTAVVAVRIKSGDDVESSHMLAFNKSDKSDNLSSPTNADTEKIIITNRVTISLNTDAVVLDYGLDADPNFTTYDFQATVRGASKNDVVWSVDNESFVTVDVNGLVSVKEDLPSNVGDFSVKLKVQSVVGGVTAYADILFVEKTPLGKVEFLAPYISGYSDGTFRPKQSITRAEVATIFAKILNLKINNPGDQVFTDVGSDHWGYSYIQAMYTTGIFSGYSDGSFDPSSPITRAEIAQVITNYWHYSKVTVNATHVIRIPDVEDDYWAADAIHRLYNTRVSSGYINNAYRPYDDTMREELVYMVNKLLGREPITVKRSKFKDVSMDYFYHGDIEAASEFYVKKRELTE